MKDFRTLIVWQKSHELAVMIYQETKKFQKKRFMVLHLRFEEQSFQYPLILLKVVAVEVTGILLNLHKLLLDSANESEYLILLSNELGFIDKTDSDELTEKVTEIRECLLH